MHFDNLKSVDHLFTASEYEALEWALPLLYFDPKSSFQMRHAMTSAIVKVQNRSDHFLGHEMDAIATSVELAIQLLSGNCPEIMESIQSEPQFLHHIQSNFFVLNQLFQELSHLKASL